jgi:GNAT superfamily N-acetyltransferase
MAWETEQRRLDGARVRRGVAALLRDRAKGTYYLAEVAGQVAGQLLLTHEWSDWRNGKFWWIQSVYVAAAFRRRGIFRALFQHVLQEARAAKGVCGLRLYMDAHNTRARQTYECLGLRQTDYHVFEMDFVLGKRASRNRQPRAPGSRTSKSERHQSTRQTERRVGPRPSP